MNDFLEKEFTNINKLPWYSPSSAIPPALPPLLEMAFQSMYNNIMDPANWALYTSNLPSDSLGALKIAKKLSNKGIGTYLQDKGPRVVFADLQITNTKIESVLSDTSKYQLHSD